MIGVSLNFLNNEQEGDANGKGEFSMAHCASFNFKAAARRPISCLAFLPVVPHPDTHSLLLPCQLLNSASSSSSSSASLGRSD